MGNVLAPIIPAMIGLATSALSYAFRLPARENPALAGIRAIHLFPQLQRQAEQSARVARALAEQIAWRTEQDREEVRMCQEVARRAAREVERMREQMEYAVNAARRAQELSEAAAKSMHEAQVERERSRIMHGDAERAIVVAAEQAERAQVVADEQCHQAEVGRAQAEEAARAATAEAEKAKEAEEEAERRLKEGIQPVVVPSIEQVAAAKSRIQYQNDRFHFAIAGVSGSGKSSLVNSFRGLRSSDAGAAAVGVTETTLEIARYPDPNPKKPFVWFDVPGAGTLRCRDWQYFNDQGLYVFDCIVVLFDTRFTAMDVAILTNASRFNIPTYIVRSKADQHIRNVAREMGYNSEDEDGEGGAEGRDKLYEAAREQFIERTRKSVETNLKDANLPLQRVYIISNLTMLSIVLNKIPKKAIDELDLVNDLLNQAYTRRGVRESD